MHVVVEESNLLFLTIETALALLLIPVKRHEARPEGVVLVEL